MIQELEWKTRRERINKKLISLKPGWIIIKYKDGLDTSKLKNHAIEEYPTSNGPADYALFVNGVLLGIIEAKKVTVNPQNVLEQAKRYSKGITGGAGQWGEYGVPFLFASNGELVWFADIRIPKYKSRTLSNFHTCNALAEFFERNETDSLNNLFAENPSTIKGLRPYQLKAIEKTEQAIAEGKRNMLIAMATGTGKTRLTVSQIYRLLESGLVKRVLFLVDRRSLAAQAVRTFASFDTPKGNKFNTEYEVYSQRFQKEDFDDDEPFDPQVLPNEYLTNPKANHTFVYVCTIQRMTINLFGHESYYAQNSGDAELDDDAGQIDIPLHAFDLIIADECHRGYTGSQTAIWRRVLEHFDAVKIGLTATPAPTSLSLFKEVIYRYDTEEAITDGFLVDYEPYKISSEVRINGAFLKEGEHVGLVDSETGNVLYDELEDEREFSAEQVEREITAPESNKKIIEELAKHAYEHEKNTGRFPKILIFAVNDVPHTSHADQLVNICREVFTQGDDFVQKITGNPNVDRPLQKIREFRNRPNPKIVVTVDMLSTGVDIPSIEFIVFLRPVKSRILWVQMLGRGTRRCDEINKDHFKVFDCFDGTLFEYFKNTTDFKIEQPQGEPLTLEQVIEFIYQNVNRPYYTKVLIKRLRRIEQNMAPEARELFADYIEDGDIKKFTDELISKIQNEFTETMNILRDKKFQDLLINYPRANKQFVIGYEVKDTVSSELLFKLGDKNLKPEDYLQSFERFVKENPEHIDAIDILLKKPREWKTKPLEELRMKLRKNSYSELNLQKVHELKYGKALADIVSMVKHAAKDNERLLNATERVGKAFDKFMTGKTFTDEQIQWLGLIKEHLIANLTIELSDLDENFVFIQHGGLSRAKKVFNEQLESIITELNYNIAA